MNERWRLVDGLGSQGVMCWSTVVWCGWGQLGLNAEPGGLDICEMFNVAFLFHGD